MRDEIQGRRAALLRRTGRFDTLIAEYEGKKYKNETIAAVIAFELRLAKAVFTYAGSHHREGGPPSRCGSVTLGL